MGRETRLLLGFLALLAGVFLGVLSMKLLVRRPPPGAGPDVHADIAVSESHDLVEPPALEPPPPVPAQPTPPAASRYRDPFMTPAAFADRADAAPPPPSELEPLAQPPTALPAIEPQRRPEPMAPARDTAAAVRDTAAPPMEQSRAEPMAGGTHVAAAGDSWWTLAEKAYGDGRLYRALFAWNRAVDPRVSLVPGTAIEIPRLDRLQAAWPTLLPTD